MGMITFLPFTEYHVNVFRKIRKAVIPAAGFGTRMLPATKSIPKELLTVVDRPVLDYIVARGLRIPASSTSSS